MAGATGYDFYLGKLRLPVTPERCELRIKNRNETLALLGGGEASVLKTPGLSEIEFDCLLPQVPYPFAKGGFQSADYYLEEIERLKLDKKPFQFIVARSMPSGRVLFSTNLQVSLEEYSIIEDADNGFDVTVRVHLKQYRPFGMKTVSIQPAEGAGEAAVTEQPSRAPSTVQPTPPVTVGCDVILNGQVHRDSYGSGPGKTFSNYRGKINFINEKGSHPYHVATPSGGWLGWVTAGSVQAVV